MKGVADGDLLEIEVELDADGLAWPDEEWLALFREYRAFPADLEEPRLEHGKLRFEAHDEDIERAWAAIKLRVAETNRLYDGLLSPRVGAERRAEEERRADLDKRIDEAQALLDSLD